MDRVERGERREESLSLSVLTLQSQSPSCQGNNTETYNTIIEFLVSNKIDFLDQYGEYYTFSII